MNILVLNGSPRKNGNVAKMLRKEAEKYSASDNQIIWHDVSDLNFSFCKGCMACRSKSNCVLREDDAHKIAQEIKNCSLLIVGTPVYWGNMNGKLKSLFDRIVYVMMGEKKYGIPFPLNKGKKAVIITSCTTPFPFNYICHQSTGAGKALKEILKCSGFKIIRTKNLAGTKEKE